MLGACYYKSAQFFMADSAFRHILDVCTDNEIRKKAREGVLATAGRCGNKGRNMPAEFGACAVQEKFVAAWLD